MAGSGFVPINNVSSLGTVAVNEYSVVAATAAAIYLGDPVKQATGGEIVVAAAGDLIIGIFAGCKYYDEKGQFITSPNWPANTGATDVKALVYDDPKTKFEVLADAAVTAANIGALYDFVYAAGSTVNGQSAVLLGISTLATADKQFRITALGKRVGASARTVEGIFVEHSLLGIVAGVGGI